ncbi:hypothetical protein WA158_001894 [Blastocystis sp. Blastoise]
MNQTRFDIDDLCKEALSGIGKAEPHNQSLHNIEILLRRDPEIETHAKINIGYTVLTYLRYFGRKYDSARLCLNVVLLIIDDPYIATMMVNRNILNCLKIVMDKFDQDNVIVESSFNIIEKLMNSNESYNALMERGIIYLLVARVDTNRRSENVVRHGLSLLRSLIIQKHMDESILTHEVYSQLIDSLYSFLLIYPENAFISLHAVYIFSWIVEKNDKSLIELLLKQNIFQYIDLIVDKQREDQCVSACFILANQVVRCYNKNNGSKERLFEFISVSQIIRSTTSLLQNVYMFDNGEMSTYMILFLSEISKSLNMTSMCVSQGIIPILINIYTSHKNKITLLTACLCFLNTIASTDTYYSMVYNQVFINSLLSTLLLYKEDEKFVITCLGMIQLLAKDEEMSDYLFKKDIYSYINPLFTLYINNSTICQIIVGILINIVTKGDKYVHYFLDSDIIKYISCMLFNNENNNPLIYNCLSFLLFLSYSEKGVREILQAGIEPFLEDLLPDSIGRGCYELCNALSIRIDMKKIDNIII